MMQGAVYSDPDLPGKLLPDKSRSDRIILNEGNCWYLHGCPNLPGKDSVKHDILLFEVWKEEDCYGNTHICGT